jgi:hypothetical protein
VATGTTKRRFFTRRRIVAATAAIAALVAAAWVFLPNVTLRGEVSIVEAELRSPDNLTLVVDSCNGDPSVSSLRMTDQDVQVEVRASSTPFSGGQDCQDVIDVELEEPLGDRAVVDLHSGQTVEVTRLNAPA